MYVLMSKDLKILANVYELESKKVVVEWTGDVSSIVIHDNMENFRKISVDGNPTRCILSYKFVNDLKKNSFKIT